MTSASLIPGADYFLPNLAGIEFLWLAMPKKPGRNKASNCPPVFLGECAEGQEPPNFSHPKVIGITPGN